MRFGGSAPFRRDQLSRRESLVNVASTVLPPLLAFVVLGLVWQLVAAHNSSAVPGLGLIWRSLMHEPMHYLDSSFWTIDEMAVGLVASATVSFLLAVVMVHLRVIERALMPIAVILNVTPVVSFAPALLLLFGFSMVPRYIVTGIIVFFPFLINSFMGLRAVDREALDYLRTLDASKTQVLWRLRLPSSLPYLFVAARIGVPLSLVGAVVAEFTTSGNSRGLGSMIEIAYAQYGDLPVVYGAVFCLALIGISSSAVVVVLERRLVHR